MPGTLVLSQADPCFPLIVHLLPSGSHIVGILKAPRAGEQSRVECGLAYYAFCGLPGSSGWMGSEIPAVLML